MTPKHIAQLMTEDVGYNNGLIVEHRFKDILQLLGTLQDDYGNPILPEIPRDPQDQEFLLFGDKVRAMYSQVYGVDFREDPNIEQLSSLLQSLAKGHGEGGDPSAQPGVSPRSQVGRPGTYDRKMGREAAVMRRDERLDQPEDLL